MQVFLFFAPALAQVSEIYKFVALGQANKLSLTENQWQILLYCFWKFKLQSKVQITYLKTLLLILDVWGVSFVFS